MKTIAIIGIVACLLIVIGGELQVDKIEYNAHLITLSGVKMTTLGVGHWFQK